MKQIQLIALLLAAAGLTACSSDEGTGTVEAPLKMIVDVTENPFTDTSSSAKMRGTTRATYTTTESLSDFSMNYMESKYEFNKTGGSWDTKSWPTKVEKSEKIDFYAYTGGTFNYNGGSPYIAYTVNESASNQHDLLVAKHEKICYNDAGGHVSLSFDHACAAVLLKVKISNTLKTQLGSDLTVNSIVLKNVNNSGKYEYDTKSWTNVGGTADYTMTNGDLTVTTTFQELPCGYLFMIPQNRAANGTAGTYLEVTYTLSGQTQTVATIPFAVNWQAGSLYPIEINLGTSTIK